MNIWHLRGREWIRLCRSQQARAVESAFEHWRATGFPYYRLSCEQLRREFQCLAAQPAAAAFRSRRLLGSVIGLRVANSFHPQMWSVRVSRYRSPMDVFSDDGLLRAALRRSWTIWPDRFGANSSCLRRILKTFPGTASVSNFRPTVARAIIDRYSSEGATVLDFSAGYGGRLLASLTMNRQYVGIEPAIKQVNGLTRMLASLRNAKHPRALANVLHGCAEETLRLLPPGMADLVFSSPPYHDWERYSDEASQSYKRYGQYEGWLTGFLVPVLWEGKRVLAPGGRLVLNVSNRRLPDSRAVERLAHQAGFFLRERLHLLLARVPYLHPTTGPYKGEYLLVFAKR